MKTVKRVTLGKLGTEVNIPEIVEIKRVSDSVAENLVATRGFFYCPKSEWKKNVRDLNPVPEAEKIMKEEGGTFTVS